MTDLIHGTVAFLEMLVIGTLFSIACLVVSAVSLGLLAAAFIQVVKLY